MAPWITGSSGVFSGIGHNPSAAMICVRRAAARRSQAALSLNRGLKSAGWPTSCGAARVQPVTGPAGVAVERVDYRGWPGCFRLTNGTVEVVVVPQVGRAMRYGPAGGPNLLWENPALAGRDPDPSTAPTATWANFGG